MKNAITSNNSFLNEHIIEADNEGYSNTVNSNEHLNIDTNTNNRYEIPGYDTVCYWVEQSDVPEIDLMAELPCKMEKQTEQKSADGRTYIQGFVQGIALDVYINGVSIRTSLPKLLLRNNIESIFLDEVKQAHDKITDIIGFSIYKAKVTRIDVAATFIMLQPFNCYLLSLGALTRFNEETDTNGRYYFNRKRKAVSPIVLLFYNKLLEQQKKGIPVNVSFQNSFRYEIRFRKFKRSLKRKGVQPSDLEDLTFFTYLIEQWIKHFNKISINKELKQDVDFLMNRKIFSRYFSSMGIRNLGQAKLLKLISDRVKLELISKQQAYKFKRLINDLVSNNELSIQNELIKELQEKIEYSHLLYSKAT